MNQIKITIDNFDTKILDVIDDQIATTSEAEAGTDDTKIMTPLKTKEAILEFGGFAENVIKKVKNTSGGVLAIGTPVRIVGATGENVNVTVSNATSNGVPDRFNGDKNIIFGITTQSINDNAVGEILIKGTLKNYNTSAFNVGDFLFVAPTGSTLTTTTPTSPAYQICVGLVTKKATDGQVCVNVQEPIHLNDVTGINLTRATLADKQAMVYNGTEFVNRLLAKTDVGLDNIDNTSDVNKPISSATQTALNAKEPTITTGTTGQYYRGDKTFQTLDKTAVGLGNVDNTSDVNKPISSATQTALNAKLDTSLKGANNGLAELDSGGKVPSSQLPSYVDDVLEFANLAAFPITGETSKIYIALDTNIIYRWGGSSYVEISQSLALGETSTTAYRGDRGKTAYDHSQTTGNPHGTTKSDIGLGNVDNTSDVNKPISSATQTALNAKEPTITAGTSGQYYRGDKTFQTLNATAVGLDNVDNTSDVNKPISSATQTALNGKENTITAGTTGQYYRGDKTFQTLDKTAVGLSNVDNTSDVNKPISSATQSALDVKENKTKISFIEVSVSSTAATQAKVGTTTAGDYVPSAGDMLIVNFTQSNLASNPNLNIDGSGAKNILLGNSNPAAIGVRGTMIAMWYDGTAYQLFGSQYNLDQNTTYSEISEANIISTTSSTVGLITGRRAEYLMVNEAGKARTLTNKTLTSPSITTPTGLVKGDVGLGNVDNTSDVNKPISTATQTALDGKVDKVTGKGLSQEDYTTTEKNKLAGIETGAQVNTVTSVATKTGAVTLDKNDVGLGNVDNTSDVNKPISSATQTALNAKEPTITAGTTGQYYRGDKTFQTLNKSAVGLGNVDNTSDANKPVSTATQTALNAKVDAAVSINAQTGTTYTLALTDASKYLRMNNASPITLTVPKNSSVAFPTGTVITIEQQGAGVVTLAPVDGDVNLNTFEGLKTAGQYAGVQLIKVATNTWTLIGGVS